MCHITTLLDTLHKRWIVTLLALFIIIGVAANQVPTTYNIAWSSEIADNTGELIGILNKAHYQDTVIISLDSVGGDIFSGRQVVNALKTTKAKVVMRVTTMAASMAGVWIMYADKLEIDDNALVLFHTVQTAIGPITENEKDPIMHQIYVQWMGLYGECCSKVLTPTEETMMKQGVNIWLLGKDLKERIKQAHLPIEVN